MPEASKEPASVLAARQLADDARRGFGRIRPLRRPRRPASASEPVRTGNLLPYSPRLRGNG